MLLPEWQDFTYTNDDGVVKIDYKKLKSMLKDAAQSVSANEICQDAVVHFNLFHDTTPDDKFIAFFLSDNEQKIQLNYAKKRITPAFLSVLVKFSIKYKLNLYMSEFCYLTGKNRKESNVTSTNVITLDLDKKGIDMTSELPIIENVCKQNGLNLSAVFSSGRGHYLVFKLDEPYVCATSAVQLNRWKHNYNQICDLFQEYEADYKCKDISRVFRLMGSYNYKDNTHYETKILQLNRTLNTYAEIPCCKKTIEDKLFEKQNAKNNDAKKTPKRRKHVSEKKSENYLTLTESTFFKGQNKRRIKDLLQLITMRENHLGERHLFLYIIINQLNASGYSYNDALKFILEKVNPKFSLAESEYEITRQLHSVYSNNKLKAETVDRRRVEYVDNNYHCNTTQWILDTLKITEDEQKKLSVLKSKKMLQELRQHRRLAKSRCHTQNKKKQKATSINELAKTCSMEEIAQQTKLSRASVYKKLEKTPKQIRLEQENTEIVRLKADGLSIAQIAEHVNLTYETVKKRLQKINNRDVAADVEEMSTTLTEQTCETNSPDAITPIISFSEFISQTDLQIDTSPPNESTPDSYYLTLAENLPW